MAERGVFDKETRRKPLAFAADMAPTGFERRFGTRQLGAAWASLAIRNPEREIQKSRRRRRGSYNRG